MELIDGGSLADRHRRAGSGRRRRGGPDRHRPAGRAARRARGGGPAPRHQAGNVLLETGTDRVVLTDFGIAQVAGATTLTETGSFVGSPEYTAPERMSGTRTGPASDLWSLGALLCAALSGESPFRRDSLGGILHAVVVGGYPAARAGRAAPARRTRPAGARSEAAARRGARRSGCCGPFRTRAVRPRRRRHAPTVGRAAASRYTPNRATPVELSGRVGRRPSGARRVCSSRRCWWPRWPGRGCRPRRC